MTTRKYSKRKSRRQRLNRVHSDPVPVYRMKFVFSILCIALFSLVGRMAWLQIIQASVLETKARSFQTQKVQPLGTRRSIVDRNGRLVALDEQRFRLWAHPRYFNFPGDEPNLIRKPVDVARKLSSPLSMPVSELLDLLEQRTSGVKLLDGIEPDLASQIREMGISGLDLEPYLQRIYPHGPLFANVIGFLNQDRVPQAGLEQSLNKDLLRKEKTHIFRRGADGTLLPDDLISGVFKEDDSQLHLTLDARLQEVAMKALQREVLEWKAEKGVAIVMDVTNGELLALASTPTYDPNNYWDFSPRLFREWSVQDLFEPGSTFKPINLALALQEGVIKVDDTFDDTGKINIGGWPIYNHDRQANGEIDLATVLQVSSNVGMVKAMSKLEPSRYWYWLDRLGLNSSPPTDLPGAVAGHLKLKEDFVTRPIEPAVASYGQGFSLTPLKLVQLHALIANGGHIVKPHITRGFRRSKTLLPINAEPNHQLLRPEVTKIVRNWMESVVEKGSGIGVKTPGHRIGGKTGTAEKIVNGSYQPGVKICSFIASLPLDDPRYVVLVVVDEPKGEDAYGSTVAVPVAKRIIDGLLVLERIPPSFRRSTLSFDNAKKREVSF